MIRLLVLRVNLEGSVTSRGTAVGAGTMSDLIEAGLSSSIADFSA